VSITRSNQLNLTSHLKRTQYFLLIPFTNEKPMMSQTTQRHATQRSARAGKESRSGIMANGSWLVAVAGKQD